MNTQHEYTERELDHTKENTKVQWKQLHKTKETLHQTESLYSSKSVSVMKDKEKLKDCSGKES